MPELPEVETTRRGVKSAVGGRKLLAFNIRQRRLRWPVQIPTELVGQRLKDVDRRGKYLLFRFASGQLILHLGMSGSLRVVATHAVQRTHDHVEFVFDGDRVLRFNDARRFGSIHWHAGSVAQHPLLARLGPEPLSDAFDAHYLYTTTRGRKVPIKSFLMNASNVVGVGNIYANEALFRAGIRPRIAAGRLSAPKLVRLVDAVKTTLAAAIDAGGTTLRDYIGSNGEPGYFSVELSVYGKAGEPCSDCGANLKGVVLSQRQTVYCPACQT